MELQIRGNDVQISDEIRATAERHAAKLDRVAERVVDAKLELRHLTQRTGGDVIVAQVTVHAGKSVLRAEESHHDANKAIDHAMEKLERQLRRYHERRADRFGRRIEDPSASDITQPLDELDESAVIVRTKRFAVKPIDAVEAIEQMELLGHDFFLFQNSDVNEISLVYKRRDGSYGLLIPEAM